MSQLPKVAIVGMGKVGGTLAYSLAARGLVRELVLIRRSLERAQADEADLGHALAFGSGVPVSAGELADAAGSDIVVLAPDARRGPIQDRRELVSDNVALMREVVPPLAKAAPHAVYLVATNPVDVTAWHVLRIGGFDAPRVISSGTALDTARLRCAVARRCGAPPADVEGYVVGEHGDRAVVAWSTVKVRGAAPQGLDRDAVTREVREAGMRIYKSKGGSVYGICESLLRIVEALSSDEGRVLTVSTLLAGVAGVQGVFLSMPCLLGRSGVKVVSPPQLSADESREIRESAQRVLSVAETAVP